MTKTKVKAWIVLGAWLIVILLMFSALLASTARAAPLLQATETPTPTPEPDTAYYPELSTGSQIRIDRTVTFGEIYIIGAVSFVGLILLLYALFRIVTHYLH